MPSNLGDRSTYLGSTDIAAIVGLNPFASAIDVWQEKVNKIETIENDRMVYGLLLEDAICAAYVHETGRTLFRRNELAVAPYIRFHPDRLVRGESGLFDAKATWQRGGGKYGEPGTDEVPPHVRIQMVCYLGATGRQWADVGLLRRPPLSIYRVAADAQLYEWLIAEAHRFWREHVLTGLPPAPDASESYRQYLREQHPVAEAIELIATPEQALLVDELASARAEQTRADEHYSLVQNRLIAAIGDASVLIAPSGRITYRNSTPSPKWKDIADRIARVASLDLDEYRLADVAGRVGPRKFVPTFTRELEEAA
jgi:putative phage-type endonuclease